MEGGSGKKAFTPSAADFEIWTNVVNFLIVGFPPFLQPLFSLLCVVVRSPSLSILTTYAFSLLAYLTTVAAYLVEILILLLCSFLDLFYSNCEFKLKLQHRCYIQNNTHADSRCQQLSHCRVFMGPSLKYVVGKAAGEATGSFLCHFLLPSDVTLWVLCKMSWECWIE